MRSTLSQSSGVRLRLVRVLAHSSLRPSVSAFSFRSKYAWIEQRGRTGIQVLNEYYVTVTRKLDPGMAPENAWADVRALLAWDPQPVYRDLLLRAHDVEDRHGLSWWDSMIVAAAQLQNCSLLLTEDLQDGWSCDGVTVCNPFKTHVAEEPARYFATPAPVSRHRPRGRPRRKALTATDLTTGAGSDGRHTHDQAPIGLVSSRAGTPAEDSRQCPIVISPTGWGLATHDRTRLQIGLPRRDFLNR